MESSKSDNNSSKQLSDSPTTDQTQTGVPQQTVEGSPGQPLAEPTPLRKPKKWIILSVVGGAVILLGATGFFAYRNYRQKRLKTQNVLKPPEETVSNDSQPGLVYRDPCETGDKKGCIMKNAYSKLRKSSELENYTIIWDEAFSACEENPDDESILFRVEQCKLDVCDNLHLGDGNIKYYYPETEECRKEVLPVCVDGSIIENIPCACDVPAGPYAAYTQSWLENYWNKYRKNDPPIYCCSGEQQKSPCLPNE